MAFDGGVDSDTVNPTRPVGDFLQAGDLESLALLDHLHELSGVQQGCGCAGIQPGGAAAKAFHPEVAARQIPAAEVGDLQFTPGAGRKSGRKGDGVLVEEIEPGDGVIGLGLHGLFLDREHTSVGSEFDDSVGFGVGDVVAENGRTGRMGIRGLQRGDEFVAVEEIVAKDQGAGLPTGEEADVGSDRECLRKAVGRGLFGVAERDAKLVTVSKEALKEGKIGRRGDDEYLPDTRQHKDRQGIVYHRLVVNRHELLGDRDGERIKPRAGATCQDDAPPLRGGGRSS